MKDTGWYKKGSAFGAIDSTGAVVIPIEYTNSLTSVNNGRLGVQKMLLGFMWI